MDAVDTLAEAKNKIQCPAISTPVPIMIHHGLLGTAKDTPRHFMYAPRPITVRKVRQKTRVTASMLISTPKMAVKPQRRTIK
jgi:hypothetical protein